MLCHVKFVRMATTCVGVIRSFLTAALHMFANERESTAESTNHACTQGPWPFTVAATHTAHTMPAVSINALVHRSVIGCDGSHPLHADSYSAAA